MSRMKSVNAAIALGSNLGDCLATLKSALEMLDKTPGIRVNSCSSWYETMPVGPPQPNYWNACACLSVEITPEQLLETLLEIEKKFGRVRRERWGPRTLDLDILLFDNLILETPVLQIPHPRIGERAFVLVPLAEIAPHWIEPVTGKTILQLLAAVDCSGVQKRCKSD